MGTYRKPPRKLNTKGSSSMLLSELTNVSPVVVDVRMHAHDARWIAGRKGVHHLLAVEDGALKCVVCRCDLDLARQTDEVGGLGRSSVVCVNARATVKTVAGLMLEHRVGVLPVLDDKGSLVGIVTRGDLMRAGHLPAERGVDLCTSCGTSHHLRAPGGPHAPVFCVPCLSGTPSVSSLEAQYFTLGGSG